MLMHKQVSLKSLFSGFSFLADHFIQHYDVNVEKKNDVNATLHVNVQQSQPSAEP